MSEINAIATNNFILHNIDAKKLYVQEPLFTANSGDAVYVGWRPDETVLWSGSIGTNSTATLSEPYTNFERIRIAGTCSNGAVSNEAYSDDLSAASIHELSLSKPTMLSTGEADGTYNIIAFMPCLFNGSTVETKNGRFLGYWGAKWQYQTNTAFALTKVIGVNRKENV